MEITGQEKFYHFRKEYPFFSYEGFKAGIDPEGINVEYSFNLADRFSFHPGFKIPNKAFFKRKPDDTLLNSTGIQSLLFHIGMIEVISYWKAACSPTLLVKGYKLTDKQVDFWKKIYYHGLGEFFYTNGIRTDLEEFITIQSSGIEISKNHFELKDNVLIPIGGGKDSVVTLELLKDTFEVRPFILNPRGASLETCFKAGFSSNNIAEINRRLDPTLLRLNDEGFLNGHTPFSALLAFYTLLVSALSGFKHIALSNESSANEPTVAGTEINHQYSKSYGFEKDFREYVSDSISEDFNYFSFLRPISELQIAMLFARNVKYYPVFKSCNAGSKTDSWCCKCPKCLFAWIILSPFIPVNELVLIFGKNLYEDSAMIGYLKELTGIDEVKPFECIGTIDEVNAALQMFIRQHGNEKWPLLIDYYSNTTFFMQYSPVNPNEILKHFEADHFLDDPFLSILKHALV
jgi:UDP-N-acetyl-alpha-D-muramoyl-L-alanyl-L-glutamate epimerase